MYDLILTHWPIHVCIGRFEYSGPVFSRDYLSASQKLRGGGGEEEKTFRYFNGTTICVQNAKFCVGINVGENVALLVFV